jgi:hypothetical protein
MDFEVFETTKLNVPTVISTILDEVHWMTSDKICMAVMTDGHTTLVFLSQGSIWA